MHHRAVPPPSCFIFMSPNYGSAGGNPVIIIDVRFKKICRAYDLCIEDIYTHAEAKSHISRNYQLVKNVIRFVYAELRGHTRPILTGDMY